MPVARVVRRNSVGISAATTLEPVMPLFVNGFESGDTTAWPAEVP